MLKAESMGRFNIFRNNAKSDVAPPGLRKLAAHYIAPRFPLKPTSMFINPTLRCSGRCAHCTVWAEKGRGKEELPPEAWRKILYDPFFNSVRLLWLSGGEPTLYEDLPGIVSAALDSLPALESITVATNAMNPAAVRGALEQIVPMLERRGLYANVHISLDGTEEIHDLVRGVEGAFQALNETVSALRDFQKQGRKLGWNFNCVMQEDNIDYLDDIESIARGLGGNITFNVAEVADGFYRSRRGEDIEEIDRRKVINFVVSLLANADPYHERHYETVRAILEGRARPRRCETLEATIYLDPDSSIYPCPKAYGMIRAKLSESSPGEIWRKAFRLRRRIRRELCPTCALGCSFGEGISIAEYIKLTMGGG